jgi:glycosyltransferase involved in cell wall biosynthesis
MAVPSLRILTFTTLYPSVERPRHGIFVETRLAHLRSSADVDLRVVAPVPWFPSTAARFGLYAQYARTPAEETRDGVRVLHPRYLTAPRVGMYTQPYALAHAAAASLNALRRVGFDFDLIDAHFLYPDGVAAAMLARRFRRPFILTARGSDVNLLMEHRWPRQRILEAVRSAGAVITVSAALRDRLVAHGVDGARVQILRNGVDTGVFQPVPRAQARAALGLPEGPLFAAVGNLVPEKGFDLVVDAVATISEASLMIVGDGPERARLEARAAARGIGARVHFLPVRPQRDLASVYSAADVLVLASAREGWPNVLLEAMACGTPVVATAVGGVPEIVTNCVAGRVVGERSAAALADAMRAVLADPPDQPAVAAFAAQFGWRETALGYAAACRQVLAPAAADAAVRGHCHA